MLIALRISWLAVAVLTVSAASAQDPKTPSSSDTTAFFESGIIPELKLSIDVEGQQRLREAPREYIRCGLTENDKNIFKSIAVKLKGAAGSYRDFDDRPGLTLNVSKYKKNQRFHGMEKFHLNNAVQDETYINEWLGAEIFRRAGYPVPLVGHVRLWINDRDLGLYVIREGFDDPFLKRSFGTKAGNFYDGGFLQDIDSELEMDSGEDPDDRQDLTGLALACYQADPDLRCKQIDERLDMDKFLSFMALERLCGHWDGYVQNMNNYRLYFPPKGKGIFLPHGMDQLFGDPNAGLFDHTTPLIAAAVMQNDRLRLKHQQRLRELAKVLQPVDVWLSKIDEMQERLRPALTAIQADLAEVHHERINDLKERFRQRVEAFPELIENGMPTVVAFDENGCLDLVDWYPSIEAEHVKVEEVTLDGLSCYGVEQEKFGDFSSSWRKQILLPRGSYRFEARIKTKDVIPIPDDQGRGAGIRRTQSGRSSELVGNNDWKPVRYEFEVLEDQRQVELVLELRARLGKAWFDRDSLKLHRVR